MRAKVMSNSVRVVAWSNSVRVLMGMGKIMSNSVRVVALRAMLALTMRAKVAEELY